MSVRAPIEGCDDTRPRGSDRLRSMALNTALVIDAMENGDSGRLAPQRKLRVGCQPMDPSTSDHGSSIQVFFDEHFKALGFDDQGRVIKRSG